MDWENLKHQLAREAREYLADLRELRDDLKHLEGWIAFGLIIASVLMTAAWLIVSLGFNPANDHISSFLYRFGMRPCRPVDNFGGVFLFVNLVLVLFLAAISLGNVFNMMRRVSRGQPREPRDLIISTSLMLVVGISGIVYMLKIC